MLARIASDCTAYTISYSWGLAESESDPSFIAAEGILFQQMVAQGQISLHQVEIMQHMMQEVPHFQ
jgi:hypothetical protein